MRPVVFACGALLPLLGPAGLARAQAPFGAEFQVNSYTGRVARNPSVGMGAGGDFVLAWQRDGEISPEGVFAQLYDAAGRKRGTEFRVSDPSYRVYPAPSLAVRPDGGFVVTWSAGNGYPSWIHARRFDASASPLGSEFRFGGGTNAAAREPRVGADGTGAFVVVWEIDQPNADWFSVVGQRFDAVGNPLGASFVVNTYTTGLQMDPALAVAPDGRFVVVWHGSGQGDVDGVFARRFDAQGAPLGPEFRVNTITNSWQQFPSVAFDATGAFVVVWVDFDSDPKVSGRRFDASGSPLGAPFSVGGTPSIDRSPTVMSEASGAFVVILERDLELYGQRFDAMGSPGAVFRVAHYAGRFLAAPVAAGAEGRGFVTAWWSQLGYGVFARRFGALAPAAVTADVSSGSGSNGNGVLEAGETAIVAPRWRNASGAALQVDGAASGFTGPAAPNPPYTLVDSTAAYSLADGSAASCEGTTDCYVMAVGVPSTRPAAHWDAGFREDASGGGQTPAVNWTLHVGDSFTDVPRINPFYRFVETIFHTGVSAGCQGGAYCPGSATTREQMAVFVLSAKEPAWFLPRACRSGQERFLDVPASSPFCRWIEELALIGVVAGCGPDMYCPKQPVARQEMAVFVLRTLSPSLDPPPCGTPIFADVPASSPFCRWIEELHRRGVVSGCGGGNYCPASPVTRGEMAVFLTQTFGLTLYDGQQTPSASWSATPARAASSSAATRRWRSR